MRIETDRHDGAVGAEDAPRLEQEAVRIGEVVQRIHAEEAIERSRSPWEFFSASANKKRVWRSRPCALQHLVRRIQAGSPADLTVKPGKPMTCSAAHFGNIGRARREARKDLLDTLEAVRVEESVVRRRDEIVVHRIGHGSILSLVSTGVRAAKE
jgi:hypothetical protein